MNEQFGIGEAIRQMLMGWLASQTDLLAEDWSVVA